MADDEVEAAPAIDWTYPVRSAPGPHRGKADVRAVEENREAIERQERTLYAVLHTPHPYREWEKKVERRLESLLEQIERANRRLDLAEREWDRQIDAMKRLLGLDEWTPDDGADLIGQVKGNAQKLEALAAFAGVGDLEALTDEHHSGPPGSGLPLDTGTLASSIGAAALTLREQLRPETVKGSRLTVRVDNPGSRFGAAYDRADIPPDIKQEAFRTSVHRTTPPEGGVPEWRVEMFIPHPRSEVRTLATQSFWDRDGVTLFPVFKDDR